MVGFDWFFRPKLSALIALPGVYAGPPARNLLRTQCREPAGLRSAKSLQAGCWSRTEAPCQNNTVSKHRYQPDWWRKRPFTVNYPFEDSFAFALLFE